MPLAELERDDARRSAGRTTCARPGPPALAALNVTEPAFFAGARAPARHRAARRLEGLPALAPGARARRPTSPRRFATPTSTSTSAPCAASRSCRRAGSAASTGWTATSARRSARSSSRRPSGPRPSSDDRAHGRLIEAAMAERDPRPRLDERRDEGAGARQARRHAQQDRLPGPLARLLRRSRSSAATSSATWSPRPRLRERAPARQDRQAGRSRRVGDDAADGQRLLQPADERHQLPGRRAAAAALRPDGSTTRPTTATPAAPSATS